MPFVTKGLDLIFSFFLANFLTGAYLSKVLLKSRRKISKPKSVSLFSMAKIQFFLVDPF